jgi:CelD/BcsL family acetyltransferase involved in cellulose biosynthesis
MDFIDDFDDAQAWDAYVENHPESRFCHLYAYRYLQDVYGYKPRYSAFRKGGRLVGVLPAFEVKSLFFGRRLVSQPFSEYGGLLLDRDLSEPDIQEIMGELKQFLTSNGARALEMHGRQGIGSCDYDPYLTKSNAQSYAYLPLDKPLEEIWGKVITYQVRKAVQKAQRSNVSVVERSDPETIVRDFYPFYVASMARLGVPPHSIKYYLRAKAAYGDRLRIFWAIHDGVPIAGLLGFACGKRINIINIVSDERFWEVRPNDLIHWEYIKWAHASGCQVFDFGSIRYEGQLHYKKKWGCIIEDHGYYFLKEKGDTSEKQAATFDSSSPTMKRMGEMWSRYVPRRVGCFIGPFLRKNLVR